MPRQRSSDGAAANSFNESSHSPGASSSWYKSFSISSASAQSGCSSAAPDQDPNSALFRIEVIKVPLAHPEQAAIVSSPRIFNDLTAPVRHGESPEDAEEPEMVGHGRLADVTARREVARADLIGPDELADDR